MSTVQAIKQLEERNVASEVDLMVWSDRMDLVALSNVKGEVTLYRLSWTKAWTLCPVKEGLRVRGIAWRPDGKIIAVAYSSGLVMLVKVEDKNIVHSVETKSDISTICWAQEPDDSKSTAFGDRVNDDSKYMEFIDYSSNFLPDPPSTVFDTATPAADKIPRSNILQKQSLLNLLLIGTKDGFVHVSVFGCFLCAIIDVNSFLEDRCSIESIHLMEDLNNMYVTIRDSSSAVRVITVDSMVFKTHAKELFAVALKQVKLTALINYLSCTISTIKETWESILLEMDNKLSKYAGKVAKGGVTADFLDLLMFGVCSDEMREFLIHDLTKRGLEKFGQTTEMSYNSIQKLLLKYVTKFGQNVTYHLAELRGMARLEHRYKILGLSEEPISDALLSNGAFVIKSGEMQQIISHSIINYKAFFRWLYAAIMHLLEEQIPPDIPKMTQQDLAYITEFLQNFDNIGNGTDSTQSGFIMERLGQYLHDSPLTILPDMSGNEWTFFLEQNKCVQNHPSILKHLREMSLIQQFNQLKQSVEKIFATPKDSIGKEFSSVYKMNCFSYSSPLLRMSHVNASKKTTLFAFLEPPENVYFIQSILYEDDFHVRGGNISYRQYLGGEQANYEANYTVLDVKFYSETILSVLLQENSFTKATVIYQMTIPPMLEQFANFCGHSSQLFNPSSDPRINGSALLPRVFKTVKGMQGSQFAVSGSRRVGIVLSENKRKIRLFEMEGEEDEDEDADMTSTTVKESDVSMQDVSVNP